MAARAREISGNRPATRSDAYTGLLIVSLLAQIIGATFFYLDWSSYPDAKPKTVTQPPQISSSAGGAPAGVPAGVPGGGAAGAPPMGGGAAMAGGAPPMGGGNPPMGGGAPPMGGGKP